MGQTYLFKLRAKNMYGWGAYSNEIPITASSVPSQVDIQQQSYGTGTTIRVNWNLPASNGDAITAYQVKILTSDGTTYAEDTTNCDGSDLTISTNRYCEIPMSVLRAAPLSLPYGTVVKAIVKATNSIGDRLFS
jgi:hypothetical protein